jgi:PAS domain S-box-containing protein
MNEHIDPAQLVEESPDAMIFADREGIIRVWNGAATRIFGHKAEDAVGQSLDLIVPERFREAHWAGFHRAMNDGATKYVGQSLPTRSMRDDGSSFYVELGFAVLLNAQGESVGALATARDITERFEQEREMRRRLTELEKAAEDQTAAGP